jgi:hypothetical protein
MGFYGDVEVVIGPLDYIMKIDEKEYESTLIKNKIDKIEDGVKVLDDDIVRKKVYVLTEHYWFIIDYPVMKVCEDTNTVHFLSTCGGYPLLEKVVEHYPWFQYKIYDGMCCSLDGFAADSKRTVADRTKTNNNSLPLIGYKGFEKEFEKRTKKKEYLDIVKEVKHSSAKLEILKRREQELFEELKNM